MVRIGILSDTHGFIDEPLKIFFQDCQEIWHAGDLGSLDVSDELGEGHVFRGVFGNIDDWAVRREFPEFLEFTVENVSVLITHIGFYSGHYTREVVSRLDQFKPRLFVCGHSHILKVKHDASRNMLHINPGAAGNRGIHQVRTAIRCEINGDRIENLDVWEMQR